MKIAFPSLGKSLVTGAAVVLALSLAGCETEEDRKIYAGQACLDRATSAAQADVCLAKIAGLETSDAYLIRCQLNFVAQGFTGPRLAQAFQGMADNSGTTDPFVGLMSQLVFSDVSIMANHGEDQTVLNCSRSGASSLERLANAAKLATLTAKIADSLLPGLDLSNFDPENPAFDPAAMEQAITEIATNATPEQAAEFGTVTLNMHASMCNSGSAFENEETCSYMNEAIGGTDGTPSAIGAALFTLLQCKQTDTCP